LRVLGEPARVSPSLVELVSNCPLRWLLTRHGGEDVRALPAVTGSLVHRLVQAVAAGATDQQLERALAEAWAGVDAGAPWYSRAEQQRVRQMVEMFRSWWRDSRGELTEVGCEQEIEVQLPPVDNPGDIPAGSAGPADGSVGPADAGGQGSAVLLRGRVDRLERDGQGRPVIVDVKSSKTPLSKEAAEDHAQLTARSPGTDWPPSPVAPASFRSPRAPRRRCSETSGRWMNPRWRGGVVSCARPPGAPRGRSSPRSTTVTATGAPRRSRARCTRPAGR
jgi:hypothetical protein